MQCVCLVLPSHHCPLCRRPGYPQRFCTLTRGLWILLSKCRVSVETCGVGGAVQYNQCACWGRGSSP